MKTAHEGFFFENSDEDGRSSERRSKRSRENAEAYLPLLVRRLTNGAYEDIAPGPQRDVLIRYCMDALLSLDWYKRRIRDVQRELQDANCLAYALGVVAFGGLIWSSSKDSSYQGAQFGVVIGAIFYATRFLLSGTDYKSRLGAFWKASSELKSSFYALEEHWRGEKVVINAKPGEKTGQLSDEFFRALKDELKKVQGVLDAERNAFFETFRNPSEVIGDAITSFNVSGQFTKAQDAIRSAVSEKENAAQKASLEVAQKLTAATQAVVAQKAVVEELEYVVDFFQRKGSDTGSVSAKYEEELIKAKAKLQTVEKELNQLKSPV